MSSGHVLRVCLLFLDLAFLPVVFCRLAPDWDHSAFLLLGPGRSCGCASLSSQRPNKLQPVLTSGTSRPKVSFTPEADGLDRGDEANVIGP